MLAVHPGWGMGVGGYAKRVYLVIRLEFFLFLFFFYKDCRHTN